MQEEKFRTWLKEVKKHSKRTVQNRISNCRNVENYHKDLDIEYSLDKGNSLINDLCYNTQDLLSNAETNHKVPIVGDKRTGSATLKAAVKLYMEFCKEV